MAHFPASLSFSKGQPTESPLAKFTSNKFFFFNSDRLVAHLYNTLSSVLYAEFSGTIPISALTDGSVQKAASCISLITPGVLQPVTGRT